MRGLFEGPIDANAKLTLGQIRVKAASVPALYNSAITIVQVISSLAVVGPL